MPKQPFIPEVRLGEKKTKESQSFPSATPLFMAEV